MTCYEATLADIPGLVDMGVNFHEMSPHRNMGEYNKVAISNVLTYMIQSPDALVITNGEGLIGGIMAAVYFDPSKMMMEESFWWASRGGREMLDMFIRKSREMGAAYVLLSTLENDRIDAMGRILQKSGFAPIERRYLKELN